jgi:hypothetical protein
MEGVFEFVGLPPQYEIDDEGFSAKNTRAYEPLSAEVSLRKMLLPRN